MKLRRSRIANVPPFRKVRLFVLCFALLLLLQLSLDAIHATKSNDAWLPTLISTNRLRLEATSFSETASQSSSSNKRLHRISHIEAVLFCPSCGRAFVSGDLLLSVEESNLTPLHAACDALDNILKGSPLQSPAANEIGGLFQYLCCTETLQPYFWNRLKEAHHFWETKQFLVEKAAEIAASKKLVCIDAQEPFVANVTNLLLLERADNFYTNEFCALKEADCSGALKKGFALFAKKVRSADTMQLLGELWRHLLHVAPQTLIFIAEGIRCNDETPSRSQDFDTLRAFEQLIFRNGSPEATQKHTLLLLALKYEAAATGLLQGDAIGANALLMEMFSAVLTPKQRTASAPFISAAAKKLNGDSLKVLHRILAHIHTPNDGHLKELLAVSESVDFATFTFAFDQLHNVAAKSKFVVTFVAMFAERHAVEPMLRVLTLPPHIEAVLPALFANPPMKILCAWAADADVAESLHAKFLGAILTVLVTRNHKSAAERLIATHVRNDNAAYFGVALGACVAQNDSETFCALYDALKTAADFAIVASLGFVRPSRTHSCIVSRIVAHLQPNNKMHAAAAFEYVSATILDAPDVESELFWRDKEQAVALFGRLVAVMGERYAEVVVQKARYSCRNLLGVLAIDSSNSG